jgi:hypothetical protein
VKTSDSSRILVWISITLMVAIYVAAVYGVYRASQAAAGSIPRLLPLATSMAVVPLILVIVLAIISTSAKMVRYAARVRAIRVSPEIRETLASVAVGDGNRERLRWLARHHPRPFEVIFTEFLTSFRGQVNSELSILAVELRLAERWRRAARSRNYLVQKTALANLGRIGHAIDSRLLRHPLEQTRIEAARALLASGSADASRLVFRMLPDQSLLGRILLSDSLRPFATEISGWFLPDGIGRGDIRRAGAILDLLRAWELWIPIDSFARVVAGQHIDLRLEALPVLRYASATEEEAAQEIVDLLQFPDERFHAPAAKAASDMGIRAAIPLLISQLRAQGPVPALAAAKALAGMGSEGRQLLENEMLTSARPQYALQALEQSLMAGRG